MTEQEQREAIALEIGWRRLYVGFNSQTGSTIQWWRLGNDEDSDTATLPNYPRDLNSMHDAEKMLTDEQWKNYVQRILSPLAYMSDGISQAGARKLASATAPQRCEAFLRTIGKWKD